MGIRAGQGAVLINTSLELGRRLRLQEILHGHSLGLSQMNALTFDIVQVFLSCLHATLFTAQLPWKGTDRMKNLLFSLINLYIAIVVSSSSFFYVFISANLIAISIAAGGIWIRRDKNAPCDCFGVLNDELGKRSNSIGFVIVAANLLAFASSASMSGAGERPLPTIPPHISGGMLLFLAAFVFARVRHPKTLPGAHTGRTEPGGFHPNEPAHIAVPADMVLGNDQRNMPISLASIRPANLPFGLLIVADGCQSCKDLKGGIAALRNLGPLPLWSIAGAPGPALEANSLHDHDQKLRQLAGVRGTPCLLLMNAGDDAIIRKVYGAEYISAALLELIGKSQLTTHAADRLSPERIESIS